MNPNKQELRETALILLRLSFVALALAIAFAHQKVLIW